MRRKKKTSPQYKPYWHYVIMHLTAMREGHSSPLERMCLRHGFKLVPVDNPHEHGVDLNPHLKEHPAAVGRVVGCGDIGETAEYKAMMEGRNQGRLDTWELAFRTLANAVGQAGKN